MSKISVYTFYHPIINKPYLDPFSHHLYLRVQFPTLISLLTFCPLFSNIYPYFRVFDFCQASIAQLVEQLICNQQVVGSTPTAGSSLNSDKS